MLSQSYLIVDSFMAVLINTKNNKKQKGGNNVRSYDRMLCVFYGSYGSFFCFGHYEESTPARLGGIAVKLGAGKMSLLIPVP